MSDFIFFVYTQRAKDFTCFLVYTHGFKSWEFGKEASQIFGSGASGHS